MSIKNVLQRVTKEHEDLWDNIEKLQNFRDGPQPSNVNDYQWKMLKKQLKAMRKYNKILAKRLNDIQTTYYEEGFAANRLSDLISTDEVTFKPDDSLISNGKQYSKSTEHNNYTEHWSSLMPGYVIINYQTGEWTPAPTLINTPGQSPVAENYDLSTAKVQASEDFMKDEGEDDLIKFQAGVFNRQ